MSVVPGVRGTGVEETREPSFLQELGEVPRCTAAAPARLRGDPWRYLVGITFCLLSISNAMQWITFGAIVDEVRLYFNMSSVQVNHLATTYVIAYVSIVFLSCKLYELTGLKVGIVIAAAANTIGSSLKLVAVYAWPNMTLLYMAQVLNSITEVLTIATPPLIANRWFPEGQRMIANTVLSSALNLGCGVGVLVPTFFVTPEKQERKHFANLFWFQFSLCACVLLMAIFFVPSRPRYMASYAAARQQRGEEKRLKAVRDIFKGHIGQSDGELEQHEHEQQQDSEQPPPQQQQHQGPEEEGDTYLTDENDEQEVQPINVFSTIMDSLRMLKKNPSFAFLMIASAAELGLIWAVATVLPQCLSPFGVSEVESGWISFLNLVFGTIVAPFFTHFVERKRQYKTVLVFIAMLLTINMSIFVFMLVFGPSPHENRKYYVVAAFILWGGVAGLCQNFIMPLMFEFVIELTFPMAESTSAPTLMWAACLSNLILTVVFGEVLGEHPTRGEALNVFMGATLVCFFGGLALLLVYPYGRRREYELLMKERDETQQFSPPLQE
ncbi:MFS transporter [Trypanosoma cruzi]|nr:MFS transporter [Trypanosoma cruzi]